MNNLGFKMSKPKENVFQASDALLGYGDNLNAFRIAKKLHNPNAGDWLTVDHSLGYVPNFLAFYQPNADGIYFPDLDFNIDDTDCQLNWGGRAILFINPARGTPPVGSKEKLFQVSDEGVDVKTAKPTEARFDLSLEQMQIAKVINMELDLPAVTLDVGETDIRTMEVTHDMGYLPVINPCVWNVTIPDQDSVDVNIDGRRLATLIATAAMNKMIAPRLLFDDEKIYLQVTRYTTMISESFGAGKGTASVTVFVNRLDETFDHTTGYN